MSKSGRPHFLFWNPKGTRQKRVCLASLSLYRLLTPATYLFFHFSFILAGEWRWIRTGLTVSFARHAQR
ncbi:hypothetical protein HYPSUDRAFT_39129 [Hypholoma sublateritium FD-334 SS-4]|uniref:Uncharacterized protein n=1 Tax=Hypholoma sublateritium (strain FD-334 SS-4) TaxID=945553 RepID=A0A0D2NZ86_HYPSF|nr:hypothetical protein HYPSUDRAFT_39129 [Hypholoma sublateritium FD-334 SS-4]